MANVDIPPISYAYARIPLTQRRAVRRGCDCGFDDTSPLWRFKHGWACRLFRAVDPADSLLARPTVEDRTAHMRAVWDLTCVVPSRWASVGGPERWDDTARESSIMSDVVQFTIRAGITAVRVSPELSGGKQPIQTYEATYAPDVIVAVCRARHKLGEIDTRRQGGSDLVKHAMPVFDARSIYLALRNDAFRDLVTYLAGGVLDGSAAWRAFVGVRERFSPEWFARLDSFHWDKHGMRGR